MPLALYTARLDPRLRDPDLLDITRAGADRLIRKGLPAPGEPFAPSWAILDRALRERVQDMEATWAWYAPAYLREQVDRARREPEPYADILARPRLVIACVCPEAERCHRVLVAALLVQLGAHAGLGVDYRGELPPQAGAQLGLPL